MVAALTALLGCGASRKPGTTAGHPPPPASRPHKPRPPFAVGERVLRLVDRSRDAAGAPRTIATVVRYPASGPPLATDVPNAPPERAAGPFPLVVFAHGYRLSPATYTRLLQTWAHAGFVAAAPAFPLTNTDAALVDRSDLVNQPQDLRFVIARLLAGPLGGVIDSSRIALGGHSDGVDSALAVVYGARVRDRRVRAALGFSGAEIAAFTGFGSAARGVPLLAAQGTGDTVNPPSGTYSYFADAPRPKYLLRLIGAEHTAPYQDEQPHLGVVERVSTAFLDRYLKGDTSAPIAALGSVPGLTTIEIDR